MCHRIYLFPLPVWKSNCHSIKKCIIGSVNMVSLINFSGTNFASSLCSTMPWVIWSFDTLRSWLPWSRSTPEELLSGVGYSLSPPSQTRTLASVKAARSHFNWGQCVCFCTRRRGQPRGCVSLAINLRRGSAQGGGGPPRRRRRYVHDSIQAACFHRAAKKKKQRGKKKKKTLSSKINSLTTSQWRKNVPLFTVNPKTKSKNDTFFVWTRKCFQKCSWSLHSVDKTYCLQIRFHAKNRSVPNTTVMEFNSVHAVKLPQTHRPSNKVRACVFLFPCTGFFFSFMQIFNVWHFYCSTQLALIFWQRPINFLIRKSVWCRMRIMIVPKHPYFVSLNPNFLAKERQYQEQFPTAFFCCVHHYSTWWHWWTQANSKILSRVPAGYVSSCFLTVPGRDTKQSQGMSLWLQKASFVTHDSHFSLKKKTRTFP